VRRGCNNGGSGESNELVNSDFPTLPLYRFLVMERGLRRGAKSGNGSTLIGR
jgi:hypothetical protein